MRVVIPQIAWHARDPVLTLDFDPNGKTEQGFYRLATGGSDHLLLIWHLTNPQDIKPELRCVAELNRHQKAINVCRFSPCGGFIAAGDDDAYIFIWRHDKSEDASEKEETWTVDKVLRKHVEDVSDVSWSSDGNFLVSGSVDNTAVLWDVKKGTVLHLWSEREHTGFVQGVAYDPLGELSASMCIDRNLRFFNNKTGKVVSRTLKYPPAWLGTSEEDEGKENMPQVCPEQNGDKPSSTPEPLPSNEKKEPLSDVFSPVKDKPSSDTSQSKDKDEPMPEVSQENEKDKLEIDVSVRNDKHVSDVSQENDKPVSEVSQENDNPQSDVFQENCKPTSPVTQENDDPMSDDSQEKGKLVGDVSQEKDKPLSELNTIDGLSGSQEDPNPPPKKPVTTLNRLFHDDTLKTFCRRLNYSPRGELLMVPGGLLPPVEKKREGSAPPAASTEPSPVEDEDSKDKPSKRIDPDQNNALVIFCRNSWTNPCAVIPTGASYSIAARFNPVYFERERQPYSYDPEFVNSNKRSERIVSCIGKLRPPPHKEGPVLLDMPYRLVYAVATNDSVIIGDTGSIEPLACVRNIHCTRMTDISWSPDGLVMIASSTDGYCSILTFEKGELGAEFKVEGDMFPTLSEKSFPIAPPEPKPVKEKVPKEAKEKEPKVPKEKKEKVPKEKKEKEPKEKKEKEPKEKKEKKVKKPATPVEPKDKKDSTLMKMLAKSTPKRTSPSTSSEKAEEVDASSLQVSTQSSASTESATTPSATVVTTTPKATFMDNWIKKTPKSASQPQPRRIQLTTLPSSSGTAKPNEASLPTASVQVKIATNGNGLTLNSSTPPPRQQFEKQPRRVALVTLTRCDVQDNSTKTAKSTAEKSASQDAKPISSGSDSSNKAETTTSCQTTSANTSTSVNSPSSQPNKQPRRIQLVTLSSHSCQPVTGTSTPQAPAVNGSGSVSPTQSAGENQPDKMEVDDNQSSETLPIETVTLA